MYRLQWSWDLNVPIREVSSFQRVLEVHVTNSPFFYSSFSVKFSLSI